MAKRKARRFWALGAVLGLGLAVAPSVPAGGTTPTSTTPTSTTPTSTTPTSTTPTSTTPTIFYGVQPHSTTGSMTSATETITSTLSLPPGLARASHSQGNDTTPPPVEPITPNANNQGTLCQSVYPFALAIGDFLADCFQGSGSNFTIGLRDLLILVNSTGFRVYMHQNADGSGWSDCFDNNQAYRLFGRDQNPGNVQITSNSSDCTAPVGNGVCNPRLPMAFSLGAGICTYKGTTYIHPETPVDFLTNGSDYRVFLHQYANNSGWADCFDHGDAYQLTGSRDEDPGNIQVTTNSSPC